jgi:hypothetical protein
MVGEPTRSILKPLYYAKSRLKLWNSRLGWRTWAEDSTQQARVAHEWLLGFKMVKLTSAGSNALVSRKPQLEISTLKWIRSTHSRVVDRSVNLLVSLTNDALEEFTHRKLRRRGLARSWFKYLTRNVENDLRYKWVIWYIRKRCQEWKAGRLTLEDLALKDLECCRRKVKSGACSKWQINSATLLFSLTGKHPSGILNNLFGWFSVADGDVSHFVHYTGLFQLWNIKICRWLGRNSGENKAVQTFCKMLHVFCTQSLCGSWW